MSNSVAEEGTPAVKPAADAVHNNSACLIEAEPQTTGCQDHAVMDDCGKAVSNMPLNTQKGYQIGNPTQSCESVESQQLMFHPLYDQTDTERQDQCVVSIPNETPTTAEGKGKTLYHSFIRQMQQQQKHKRGRKFKMKTLMKMARLFVVAKGLDPQMMDVKHSGGPLTVHEQLVLNQKEDMFTSVSSTDTFSGQTGAPVTLNKRKTSSTRKKAATEESVVESVPSAVPAGRTIRKRQRKNKTGLDEVKNDPDKETVLSTGSTFSGQTGAPVTLNKRKTSSTRKKAATEESVVESVPSAVPAGRTIRKRQRKNKTKCTARKKLKRSPINAHRGKLADTETSTVSFKFSPCNSISGNEMVDLKMADDHHDFKPRTNAQTPTANTNVKPSCKCKKYDPRRHELKSQKPLECSFCGRSFRHITAFTVHKRIHTGEKPYRCLTCGKRFSQLSKLNAHSGLHREPCAVCCPCCSGTFKNKDELIWHFHIHMNNIKSSNMTEHSTDDADDQQVRVDSPAAPRNNKPLRCSVCLKEFLHRATFKMHRQTHAGETHTCSVCGKKFRKLSSLNSHEKTHWPVKPYSCSVCRQDFVKLQELKRHSQMHSGAAPFSCARCEKAFSSFELLRSHQGVEVCSEKQDVTHGSQSDICRVLVFQSVEGQIVTPVYFKCHICKQLQRHWCQYVLHLQTHTRGNSYSCETCRQQYDQTTEMRTHCLVCCINSGEERACTSSLSDIWKEPEAPENQVLEPDLDVQSGVEPPHEDQKDQISALPHVGRDEKDVTDMQSPVPSPSSSSLSANGDFDISLPSLKSDVDQVPQQPSRIRLQSLIRRRCGRYSCGHCGKSFSWWNKLWLHQRFHRQAIRRPFSCSQCDLEFRFLGTYIDHLREHAAQRPHACPLCPDTFANIDDLSTHISECHKRHDHIKCSTCGKIFSTLRNLTKHKLLHKRSSSHLCLPCNVSFSSNRALTNHLKTHIRRLSVPQPAGLVEPFLFPYNCRKCTAKFSSTDLLQAHQVCHFTAGKKPESPSETLASYIPSRKPEDQHESVSESSQQKRRLPVSNKKHLFRYPHPDRLYVVPVISSEPPIVISDTEEDRQETRVQSPSITTSARNTVSEFAQRRPCASFNSSDPSISSIPQFSAVSTQGNMDEQETGSSKNQLDGHSYQSSSLSESLQGANDIWDYDSDSSEPSMFFFNEKEELDDVHSCAVCMEPFTDISKLHEHYINHARGM